VDDLAHGEAVVAGTTVLLVGNNEHSGRATGLRVPGVVQEPVIECGLTAGKAFQPVLNGQQLCCSALRPASLRAITPGCTSIEAARRRKSPAFTVTTI
jgi:hypothetical protein